MEYEKQVPELVLEKIGASITANSILYKFKMIYFEISLNIVDKLVFNSCLFFIGD
jgi:hypothetical protein